MQNDEKKPSNKAERLALAAAIAPVLRETKKRLIKTYGGRVLGLAEFQQKILERSGIEFAVEPAEEKGRLEGQCLLCKVWTVAGIGKSVDRLICGRCYERACPERCPGIGGECKNNHPPIRSSADRLCHILAREGRPLLCRECRHSRIGHVRQRMSPEQRSEAGKKANASRTADERKRSAEKRVRAMSPERRSEIVRKGRATMGLAQRQASGKKAYQSLNKKQRQDRIDTGRQGALRAHATRTPEQRALIAKKISDANAARTPEQRALIAKKISDAHARRRARITSAE